MYLDRFNKLLENQKEIEDVLGQNNINIIKTCIIKCAERNKARDFFITLGELARGRKSKKDYLVI